MVPFLALAAFALLWADLIRQLSYVWRTNEQYAYGWFVPILALGLFAKKWPTRPGLEIRSQKSEVTSPVVPLSSGPVVSGPPFLLSAFCFLLLLLLLPLRVIHEINPDWPLISWPYTAIVVALTLYAFHLAGPQSVVRGPWSAVSPWLKHFAFPVCFILVAVQWPYRIEHGLTQGLMRVVASLTVELLGWLDIPALQRGNLIDLATGTVGIDEACSGIRSFQSTFMAAILMGELYRLRLLPRAALVVCGITLGFCFNVVRTLILSWQANAHGLSAIGRWHDPAGFTITIACFLCLWAIAVLMTKWTRQHGPRTTDHNQRSVVSSPVVSSPVVRGPWSVVSVYLLSIGCWAICVLGLTEVWYRAHASANARALRWTVTLPENDDTFHPIPLPARTVASLKNDVAITGTWREPDGCTWTAYFLRWEPRSMQSVMRARGHRPEICLRASGLQQLWKSDVEYFSAGPIELPFHKYIFAAVGPQLYVFFSLWQDGDEPQHGMRRIGQGDRLHWAASGKRHLAQQTLEIILTDCPSLEDAERRVRALLPQLIRVERPGNPVAEKSQ